MVKIKSEKIVSIVDMSYLVLIPVGALVVAHKLGTIEDDLEDVLGNLSIPARERSFLSGMRKIKHLFD